MKISFTKRLFLLRDLSGKKNLDLFVILIAIHKTPLNFPEISDNYSTVSTSIRPSSFRKYPTSTKKSATSNEYLETMRRNNSYIGRHSITASHFDNISECNVFRSNLSLLSVADDKSELQERISTAIDARYGKLHYQ